MNPQSFMTANYVARQLQFNMTEGWDQGERATSDYYRPLQTFPERFGELLAKVRAMGFSALDLWTAHLNWSWATPEHITAAVRLLAEQKLQVVSLAGYFGSTVREFEKACQLAAAVKTSVLGGSTAALEADRPAVVELLKKYTLKLALENHSEKSAGEMLQKIGDGAGGVIGTAVDTGWYATQGCDAVRAIKELGRHIFLVHLKDVLAPGAHETCRYGRGCVPIGACVRALQAQGYQGGCSVEHEPAHFDPTADCRANLAMLRNWLNIADGSLTVGKRLGVGIIGCGNIAVPYAQNLLMSPRIALIAVADKEPDRAKTYAAKFGCKPYRSTRALLADPTIELVVNLTIHHAHKKVTTQCLTAGKHVHSEKPLALKYRDAQKLVALAHTKNVRLGCSPFTFMGEAQQTAWKLIRQGRLGTVRVAYAEVNWGRIELWHPNPAPFYEVGALFDVGVYPLTVLTTILGPARRVAAYGKVLYPDRQTKDGTAFHIDTPDFVTAMVELANGTLVRLTTNFYVANRTTKQTGIEFHGDRGSLYLSSWCDFNATVEFAEFGQSYSPVTLVKEPYPGIDWGRAVSDMAEAMAQGRAHRATGEQAAHVVEILGAAAKSLKSHKPVAVTSNFTPPAPMDWAV